MEQGKSKSAILQDLDFKEEEWQFLIDRILEISSYKDSDAIILFPNGEYSTLGPVSLSKKNILKLLI